MRPLSLLFAVALLAAPAMAGPAEDLAAAHKVIEALNQDSIPAAIARDVPRMARAYAADAVIVTGSGQVLAGRAAFEEAMRARFEAGLVVTAGAVQIRGLESLGPGLVLEWGEGAIAGHGGDGKEFKTVRPYTTVWQQVGGTWVIVRSLSL